jgi:hypothetical protein
VRHPQSPRVSTQATPAATHRPSRQSNPVNHNKMDAMRECIARSKPKPPDPRVTRAALNSASSIASAMNLTSNAPRGTRSANAGFPL